MTLKFLSIVLLVFCQQAIAENGPVKFVISGDIAGLGNDSVILKYEQAGKMETLVTTASKDHFEIRGEASELSQGYIYFGGVRSRNTTYLFLENGATRLKGSLVEADNITMTGAPQNVFLSESRKGEMQYYNQIPAISAQIKNETDPEKVKKLNAKIQLLRDSVADFRVKFIDAHPSSMASLMNLWVLQDNIAIPLLERLFNKLDPSIQASGFGPKIKDKIVARKRTVLGNAAPAFTIKELGGSDVSMAGLKGKYVLLDFWASWCVPCRAENPYLKTAYQKFKDKNFVILSVSVDESREKWIEAIKKDELPWMHVIDGAWPKDGIANLYGVQPIPDNFLIDPSGKIIARALRGEELEGRLATELQKGVVKSND